MRIIKIESTDGDLYVPINKIMSVETDDNESDRFIVSNGDSEYELSGDIEVFITLMKSNEQYPVYVSQGERTI